MRSKPAELSASLVAVKGAAAPSPDMPGRAGPAAGRRAAGGRKCGGSAQSCREVSGARQGGRGRRGERGQSHAAQFSVSGTFRREFKTYAASHDFKLNELLRLCFEAYRGEHRD